jgi:hypothetical protein
MLLARSDALGIARVFYHRHNKSGLQGTIHAPMIS